MEALHEKLFVFFHPEVWQVVCDGVDFLKKDEQLTPDQF
jgi:hypothetical protein